MHGWMHFSPSLLSLSPSLSLSLHTSLHLSPYVSPYLSISVPVSISPYILSLHPVASLSYLFIFISIYFSISISLFISQEVEEKTPCLFLLALDAHELKVVTGRGGGVPAAVGSGRGGSGGAAAPRLWLLVAWIPDDAKVGALSVMFTGYSG